MELAQKKKSIYREIMLKDFFIVLINKESTF